MTSHTQHLEYLEAQKSALEAEIDRYAQRPPWRAGVEALCCFRGIQVPTAMTLLTEIGDIRRFSRPTGLMAFAGLVPSERSNGEVQRRGAITKAGSGEIRRVLIEASWHHRHEVKATLHIQRRRQGQSPQIVGIAVKARHRLKRKFYKIAGKKHPCVAATAVARELCAFIWYALQTQAQEA